MSARLALVLALALANARAGSAYLNRRRQVGDDVKDCDEPDLPPLPPSFIAARARAAAAAAAAEGRPSLLAIGPGGEAALDTAEGSPGDFPLGYNPAHFRVTAGDDVAVLTRAARPARATVKAPVHACKIKFMRGVREWASEDVRAWSPPVDVEAYYQPASVELRDAEGGVLLAAFVHDDAPAADISNWFIAHGFSRAGGPDYEKEYAAAMEVHEVALEGKRPLALPPSTPSA